jgi:cobalt-zinc-cadmium resistance protein CzcA
VSGTRTPTPALTGSTLDSPALPNAVARRLLRDLVSADGVGPDGKPMFLKPGASTVFREQGQRLIAIKFDVRGRDLAGTVAEAQRKVAPLIPTGYRTVWSGEFEQMEAAEARLVKVFGVSLLLILVLLYLAFRSALDVLVVFANVIAMAVGGIWALWLTGLNFNISAAVGFISILGVAVMNGLIMVSSFNRLRAEGMSLEDALHQGVEFRIRPLFMTMMTALLGLLPAAFSTKIGAQSQRPLAIVVVGGMLATLLFMNLVPVLYSFYGKHQVPSDAGGLAH